MNGRNHADIIRNGNNSRDDDENDDKHGKRYKQVRQTMLVLIIFVVGVLLVVGLYQKATQRLEPPRSSASSGPHNKFLRRSYRKQEGQEQEEPSPHNGVLLHRQHIGGGHGAFHADGRLGVGGLSSETLEASKQRLSRLREMGGMARVSGGGRDQFNEMIANAGGARKLHLHRNSQDAWKDAMDEKKEEIDRSVHDSLLKHGPRHDATDSSPLLDPVDMNAIAHRMKMSKQEFKEKMQQKLHENVLSPQDLIGNN